MNTATYWFIILLVIIELIAILCTRWYFRKQYSKEIKKIIGFNIFTIGIAVSCLAIIYTLINLIANAIFDASRGREIVTNMVLLFIFMPFFLFYYLGTISVGYMIIFTVIDLIRSKYKS